MFRKVMIAILSSLICGITQAAPSPKVQDVNILGVATVDNPTFNPADLIETTILANGVVVISEAQIIREIIFVPDPSATTASACTGRIYAEDHPISMVRYPADHPVSMQGPVPVPIKVDQGATFFAKLEAPVGDNGSCSAEIVIYGTRYVPPPQ